MIVKSEALRLLGYGASAPDEQTLGLLDSAITMLTDTASCRHTALLLPVTVSDTQVSTEPIVMQSKALARHMHGCEEIILFAATLGAGVDRLMQRYSSMDMSAAVVLQAAAAAMLEAYCDTVQEQLKEKHNRCDKHLTWRFSPGYGDFPLAYQAPLIRILDAGRKIGLSVTAQSMLAPTKSISAVIGVSDRPACERTHACKGCDKHDCAYRRTEQ